MIQKSTFLSALIPLCALPIGVKAQKTPTYKNVVFIVADDLTNKTLGCSGNKQIRTPNIDRLAASGTRFTNMFCNSPISSASRQSLLTGKYPTATGVSLLFTPFNDATNETIAEHLQKQGFATGLFGKTHFNSFIWGELYQQQPKFGFDTLVESNQHKEWLKKQLSKPLPEGMTFYKHIDPVKSAAGFWNAGTLPFPQYDAESEGTYTANRAIEYIEQNKDKRFCVWLAFHQPHAPFYFPIEFAGRYKDQDMVLPQGSPEDDRWVPELFRNLTDDERRGIIASYYTSVEYLDKNVGLVLDALKKQGLDENTLVVFISDNGYLLHDHKRFEKHTMWDYSARVPLIISGKGLPQQKVTDAITEGVDVVPTVCDLLRVPAIKQAQGVSFKEVLTGTKTDYKPYAYSVFLEDNLLMISSKEWKYVFMTGKRDLGLEYATGFGAPGISQFLYNRTTNPDETRNVIDLPENKVIKEQLQQELLSWFLRTHPDAKNIPDNLSIEGKLVWFAEPRDVGDEHGGKPLRTFKN